MLHASRQHEPVSQIPIPPRWWHGRTRQIWPGDDTGGEGKDLGLHLGFVAVSVASQELCGLRCGSHTLLSVQSKDRDMTGSDTGSLCCCLLWMLHPSWTQTLSHIRWLDVVNFPSVLRQSPDLSELPWRTRSQSRIGFDYLGMRRAGSGVRHRGDLYLFVASSLPPAGGTQAMGWLMPLWLGMGSGTSFPGGPWASSKFRKVMLSCPRWR